MKITLKNIRKTKKEITKIFSDNKESIIQKETSEDEKILSCNLKDWFKKALNYISNLLWIHF